LGKKAPDVWKKSRPKMYRELKKRGLVRTAAMWARERTKEQMAAWVRAGWAPECTHGTRHSGFGYSKRQRRNRRSCPWIRCPGWMMRKKSHPTGRHYQYIARTIRIALGSSRRARVIMEAMLRRTE